MQVMTKNKQKTDIGLIGLAVMGENLALNMADKGWHVSVYNRTVPGVEEGVVERFTNGRAKGKTIEGYTEIPDFVESISTPRKSISLIPEPKEIFPTFFNLAGIFTLPVAVRLRVPPILSSEANCSGLNPAMEILALPSIAFNRGIFI